MGETNDHLSEKKWSVAGFFEAGELPAGFWKRYLLKLEVVVAIIILDMLVESRADDIDFGFGSAKAFEGISMIDPW